MRGLSRLQTERRKPSPTAGRRCAELYAKHGLLGLVRRVASRLADGIRHAWHRLAHHRNHVFVHDGPAGETELPDGLTMARFASWEAIPEKVRDELLAYGGPRYFENIRQELVGKAVLWMGSIGDRAVAVQMTRAGCEIARWFVPLRSHDLIIFAIGTTPEHRGKGIAPAMIRHIMAKELQDDGKAYIDCKVWNKPAIRGFEKAGFRRLVTRKPLPRTRRPR